MLVKIGNKWFDPVSIDVITPEDRDVCKLTSHRGYEYLVGVTADEAAEIINEGIKEHIKLDLGMIDEEDEPEDFWKK